MAVDWEFALMAEPTRKTTQEFVLKPFEREGAAKIAIAGSVSRQGNQLQVTYQLEDPLSLVALPIKNDNPERRHELWRTTCLEFFLGVVGTNRYWEVNLSPAGHWNCYRFEEYRQGMQEEGAIAMQASGGIAALPLTQSGEVVATVELGAIIRAHEPLELGVTAVVEDRQGTLSYWAIAHTGPEADFHRRDSFTLTV